MLRRSTLGDVVADMSTADLRTAETLIRRVHDYIEINGFDVSEYFPRSHSPNPDASAVGALSGRATHDDEYRGEYACCWIGTLNVVSTGEPGPVVADEAAAAALVLDSLAAERMARAPSLLPGSLIESLGFEYANSSYRVQWALALGVCRAALSAIHRQLGARGPRGS